MHKLNMYKQKAFRRIQIALIILSTLYFFAPQFAAQTIAAPLRQEAPDAINAPLTTAFTYQGKLEKGGELVSAECAMSFSLFDAASGGIKIGNSQTINPVSVSGGLFNVALNGAGEFGANAFDGSTRFLEIAVQCTGDGSAIVLPRQLLAAAPYAITSLSTEGLQGRPVAATAPATGQALTWNGTQWSPQTISSGSGGDITAVTAGNGLTGGGDAGDVSLSLNTDVTDNLYWQLDGNGNVPATGFLGTTNNMTLTLGTNNAPALRLVPASDPASSLSTPNIIAGIESNHVAEGVIGATIGGGGRDHVFQPNFVSDSFGVVGGGSGNQAGATNGDNFNDAYATVAGGNLNQAAAANSFIGGGFANLAMGRASVVSGGEFNHAQGESSTISGGSGAITSLPGQFAYAAGPFGDEIGSAQMSMYLLRAEAVGNTTLLVGGTSLLSVRPGSSMLFRVYLVGRSAEGNFTAAYRMEGVIVASDDGTRADILLPSPTVTVLGETTGTNSLFNARIETTGGTLNIIAENSSRQSVRWVATVYTTEVGE